MQKIPQIRGVFYESGDPTERNCEEHSNTSLDGRPRKFHEGIYPEQTFHFGLYVSFSVVSRSCVSVFESRVNFLHFEMLPSLSR